MRSKDAKQIRHSGGKRSATGKRQSASQRPLENKRLAGVHRTSSGKRGALSQHRSWIGELDGLRGLAALAVMLAHFHPGNGLLDEWVLRPALVQLTAFSAANLGVVFFYALSSFLLTYLAVQELDRTGKFAVVGFYVRRTFRIWPLYFTVLLVDLWLASPLSPLKPPARPEADGWLWIQEHLWLFFGFLSNWSIAFNSVGSHVDNSTFPLGVLWSIAIEEQFYIFYPWIIGAALASAYRARLTAITLLVVAISFRTAFMFVPVGKPDIGPAGGLYYATFSYLDVFLAGGTAGFLAARDFRPAPWVRKLLNVRGVGWLLCVSILLIGSIWGGQVWYPYSWYTPIIYTATGATFALTILWSVAHPETIVARVLRTRALRTLGTLSFGVYLWHPAVILLIQHNFSTVVVTSPEQASFIASAVFALYLIGTIGVACLSYGLVERPALSLKARLSGQTSTSRPESLRTPLALWVTSAIGAFVAIVGIEIGIREYLGAATQDRVAAYLPVQRAEEMITDPSTVTARYVTTRKPEAGNPLLGDDGLPAAAQPGEVVLDDASAQLFRVDADGRAVRLQGRPGDRVRVTNLGQWQAEHGRLAGLDARLVEDRWLIDTSPAPTLRPGSELHDPRAFLGGGWGVSVAGAPPTVQHLVDDDGPFVRVTAAASEANVRVSGPSVKAADMPATLHARIRVTHPSQPTLAYYDYQNAGDAPTVYVDHGVRTGSWTSLVIRMSRTAAGDVSDTYDVGASDFGPGDTLDIRALDLFAGILPNEQIIGPWGRAEDLADTPDQTALALPTMADLANPVALRAATGESAGVEPGTLLLPADTGVLWRLESDGSYTRLDAREGQQLRIANLGAWNPRTRQVSGLTATHAASRWVVDDTSMVQLNLNPEFLSGSPVDPLPFWQLEPGDGYEVTRVEQQGQPVIQIRAARSIDDLVLRGKLTTPLADAPATARAQIRVAGSGRPVLSLLAGAAGSEPQAILDLDATGSGWKRVQLHTSGQSTPPIGEVALHLKGVAAGDMVEIREVSLFAGYGPDGPAVACCQQRGQRLSTAAAGALSVVAVPKQALLGPQVVTWSAAAVVGPLQPGATVLTTDTGALWTYHADATFSPLVGDVGQQVHVVNVGPWDAARGQVTGLIAQFDGEQWRIDTSPMWPIITLDLRGLATPVPTDWWMSPPDAQFDTRSVREQGVSFLHVSARQASPVLFLTTIQVLPQLNGVPVSATATIRASRPVMQALTLYDMVTGGQPRVTLERTEVAQQWTTLTLRSGLMSGPSEGDNVSIGIQDVAAGDWYDVRSVNLYEGILP